ncbi:hypothetical protein E4T50_16085 [Aureobasidium sp. EXF-12298]|nr:hypothetical protein E4T50_16085 [Aureobasidium sp. EXF-12298]
MRRMFASDDRLTQDKVDFAAPLSGKAPWIGLPLQLQTVLDHVSSLWPGKSPSSTPDAQSLLWMLRALKAATEVYLEKPVHYIEVTNPVPLVWVDAYVEAINSATSSLGLSLGRPYFLAAAAAAKTYNIKGICDDQSNADVGANDTSYRLFVAVNHNRAAFTASLMIEECNAIEELRTYHNHSLGSDSDVSEAERHATMKHALAKTVKPPYHESMFNPERIQDVILIGEATEDAVMRSVLEDIFGNEFKIEGRQNDRGVDPLFAASRGVALDCLDWDIDSHRPHERATEIQKESA